MKENTMKLLSLHRQDSIRAFFDEYRPLECARYAYHFHGGSVDAILTELTTFQNTDGGFGHALESDVRIADSSVLCTTVGLQILREVKASADHRLVKGAIRYLLETWDSVQKTWPLVPPNVDDAPHAPWWGYSDDLSGNMINPFIEIVGYLHDYASLVPDELLREVDELTISRLDTVKNEMHDLMCWYRLLETPSLLDSVREQITEVLSPIVDGAVERDTEKWGEYGLFPLYLAKTPESPFAEVIGSVNEEALDYDIGKLEVGPVIPHFEWGIFPEAYEESKREWTGVFTLEALLRVRAWGRMEQTST
jgi:hypothetical protein